MAFAIQHWLYIIFEHFFSAWMVAEYSPQDDITYIYICCKDAHIGLGYTKSELKNVRLIWCRSYKEISQEINIVL
jgi:hypothetical protein